MSVHYNIISGGEYAAELSKDKKRREGSCVVKGKHTCCSKGGSVFKTTWQSCEGLGLKLLMTIEHYEKVITCMHVI